MSQQECDGGLVSRGLVSRVAPGKRRRGSTALAPARRRRLTGAAARRSWPGTCRRHLAACAPGKYSRSKVVVAALRRAHLLTTFYLLLPTCFLPYYFLLTILTTHHSLLATSSSSRFMMPYGLEESSSMTGPLSRKGTWAHMHVQGACMARCAWRVHGAWCMSAVHV